MTWNTGTPMGMLTQSTHSLPVPLSETWLRSLKGNLLCSHEND